MRPPNLFYKEIIPIKEENRKLYQKMAHHLSICDRPLSLDTKKTGLKPCPL